MKNMRDLALSLATFVDDAWGGRPEFKECYKREQLDRTGSMATGMNTTISILPVN